MRMSFGKNGFSGVRPVRGDAKLETAEALEAINAKLISGELRAFFNRSLNLQLASSIPVLKKYYYLSEYWFEFAIDTDVVMGPLANDSTNKCYFTQTGALPFKTNETRAKTGSPPYPVNTYPMAAPQPCTSDDGKPTCAIVGGLGADPRDVSYFFTVRSMMEDDTMVEESPPSLPSDPVAQADGDGMDVGNLTLEWQGTRDYNKNDFLVGTVAGETGTYMYICVDGGTTGAGEPTWGTVIGGDTASGTCTFRCYKNTMTEKVLYRLATGNQYATWREVQVVALGTDTVNPEDVLDKDLSSECLTTDWLSPPQTMIGLIAAHGGMLVGFNGKDLYFSKPYYPHLWWNGSLSMNSNIVAVGSEDNSILVTTEAEPEIVTGSGPGYMTPNKRPESAPCLSKTGFVSVPGGALYPSTGGLYFLSASGTGSVVTEGHYSKKEWEDVYPDSFVAGFHDGMYIAFYTDGSDIEAGVIIDMKRGIVINLDFYSPTVFVDKASDTLYYVVKTAEVKLLEAGTGHPDRSGIKLKEDGGYKLIE